MPGFTYYDRHPETFKLLRFKFKCDEREREREERERERERTSSITQWTNKFSHVQCNLPQYTKIQNPLSRFICVRRAATAASVDFGTLLQPPTPHPRSILAWHFFSATHTHTHRPDDYYVFIRLTSVPAILPLPPKLARKEYIDYYWCENVAYICSHGCTVCSAVNMLRGIGFFARWISDGCVNVYRPPNI